MPVICHCSLQVTLHPLLSALEADFMYTPRGPSFPLASAWVWPVCGVGRLAEEWGQRYLFSWPLAARIPRLALALDLSGWSLLLNFWVRFLSSHPPASLQASWALTYLVPLYPPHIHMGPLVIYIKWAWVILIWVLGPDNASLLLKG